MSHSLEPATGLLGSFEHLLVTSDEQIVHLRLHRTDKRNAINAQLVRELHTAFVHLPSSARVAVLSAEGPHFCAGLDLSEVKEQTVAEAMYQSRRWHEAFDQIQFGPVPVVAVLQGAVVGGGLELAAAAHLRVAEPSAYFGLPEGQRGIFVGGSGSARIPRLIGASRMTDMMLTGRVLDAHEAHAVGLTNYLVSAGAALEHAFILATKIALNSPLSNYAVTQALPRIAGMAQADGAFVESLMAAIAQGDDAAKQRVRDFLEKRSAKITSQIS